MAKRVLIIEDTDDTGQAMKQLVAGVGYQVAYANDGLSGVALAATFQPDLILLDYVLPDINGFEVAHRIRKDSSKRVPLICVSAVARGLESEILTAGFDEVVSKTTFFVTFEAILDRHLGSDPPLTSS